MEFPKQEALCHIAHLSTTFLPWTPNGTSPLPRRWQLEETRIYVSSRCLDVYFRDCSFGVSQMLEDCFFKTLNSHRAPLCEFSVQVSLKYVHSFAFKRDNSILYVYNMKHGDKINTNFYQNNLKKIFYLFFNIFLISVNKAGLHF
jgi:hypothetical protein